MPKPIRTTYPNTPTFDRIIEELNACSTAHLDTWEAGWIAGHMEASGADDLPIAEWRTELRKLIDGIVAGNALLDAALADTEAIQ